MPTISQVDHKTSLGFRIMSALAYKGFCPATSFGEAIELDSPCEISVGVLFQDPSSKPKKFLFGLIKLRRPRAFLGIISFNSTAWGSNPREWVFETHGQKYSRIVELLTEELSAEFETSIKIHRKSDAEKHEVFEYPSFL